MSIWRPVQRLALASPGMTGSMATAVMSQVVLVASGVVVARALGPENRGVLALVFVLSSLAVQVGSLGVPVSVTYWIAAKGMSPRTLLRGLRGLRSLQYAAILGAHAVLILVVLEPRSPSGFLWVGLLSLVATAAGLSLMYGLAVLQGLRRFGAFNALRVLNPTLYMLGVVGLWVVDRASLTSIALVIIGASVVASGTTWLVVLRQAPAAAGNEEVTRSRIVSFGLRSLAGSAPPVETFRLDQLLVGLVLTPVALGYYIVAQAFTNLTRFIGQSIGMVTYPRVAAADESSQLRIIRRDVALGVAVSGSLTLGLILAVPWLLPFFFGSEFAPARATAQILVIAAFFASIRRILVDGTRGSGSPMWGASAELLTLLALPAAVVVAGYTDSLAAVGLVLAGANLVGLLAVAPALLGFKFLEQWVLQPIRALALPVALVGLSAAVGMGVSLTPDGRSTPSVSLGVVLAVCLVVVATGCALIRFGHRKVASLSLYACALGLALPAVRVTGWMTVSDLFLLVGGALLVPEISKPRLRSPVQRGFASAVTLIVVGGLLGTLVADNTQLSLLNLARFAVAAGATLMIFRLWAPSTAELRRFLMLVVVSGLVTGLWALTHAASNFGRPTGLSYHSNHLALVCLVAIGPALAFSLVRGTRPGARIAAAGAATTLVGAIVVSGSRAGLLGLGAAVLLAALLVRNIATRAQLAVGAAAVAVAGVVGFSALTNENAISRTFNPQSITAAASNEDRRVAFDEMADQIRREPITGVGFSQPLAGHDAYLQLWAAGGLFACLGGLLVVGSAGGAVALLRRQAPPSSVHDRSWPLLASTISLSGLLVALAFQNVLWTRYVWVTVALVAVSSAITGSEGSRFGVKRNPLPVRTW